MDIFAIKSGHLDKLDERLAEQKDLIGKIKSATTSTEARELMSQLRDVHERDELLAWQERCRNAETGVVDTDLQDRYIAASSYADEWVSSLFGHFRYWYICLAKTGEDWLIEEEQQDTCRTVIKSKCWDTKFDDPLAAKQKWYCKCHAKFNACWGVIIEMKFNSEKGLRYYRAEVPDDHVKDALSMKHERDLGNLVTTPEELYARMREVAPTVNSIIVCVDEEKGHYRIPNADDLAKIPQWSWYDLFALAGRTLPPKPVGKRNRKKNKASKQ